MRLNKVRRGDSFGNRARMFFMSAVTRRAVPDVVKVLLYRKEFFGAAMNEVFQAAMRGPSGWTVGERELMAAYVSSLNQCVF
jgi:hypothetical protein